MRTDYLSTSPRWFEIVIGCVSSVLGFALLAGCLYSVYLLFGSPISSVVVVLVLSAASMGLILLAAGVRLLLSWRRHDGGLLSPLILRLGGMVFLFAPVAMLVQRDFAIIEAGFAVAAGVACFVLANRRGEIQIRRNGT